MTEILDTMTYYGSVDNVCCIDSIALIALIMCVAAVLPSVL